MIKRLIEFIVYSNIWVATGVLGLTFQYYMLVEGSEISISVLGFVFFSTLFAYNFQRYVKIRDAIPITGPRFMWMQKYRVVSNGLMYTSAAAILFFGAALSWLSIVILILPSCISLFYTQRMPFSKTTSLRDIPGLKIYLIAITWTVATTLLPAIENSIEMIFSSLWLSLSVFLFVLAIAIPFDIRDINLDESAKRTIPQMMGISVSKILAIALLCASSWMLTWKYPDALTGVIITFLVALILVLFANTKRPELYFSFLLDGLFIFQPLIIWTTITFCQSS